MLAVFKTYVQSKKKIFIKKDIFSQITDFGRVIENFLKLREILTNDKYLVQFIVSVVIKLRFFFKLRLLCLTKRY